MDEDLNRNGELGGSESKDLLLHKKEDKSKRTGRHKIQKRGSRSPRTR